MDQCLPRSRGYHKNRGKNFIPQENKLKNKSEGSQLHTEVRFENSFHMKQNYLFLNVSWSA